jgi:hypothetical protein
MKTRYNTVIEHALNMGGLLGAIFIITQLLSYLFMPTKPNIFMGIVIGLLSLAIYIVFLIFASRSLRDKKLGHSLTYPEGLVHLLIIGTVGTIVSSAYSYAFNQYFDPEHYREAIDNAIEFIESSPQIPEVQKELQIRKLESATALSSAIDIIKSGMIISLILALLIPLFTRKKADPFTEDLNTTTEVN